MLPIEVRVLEGYPVNEFGFDHSKALGCSESAQNHRAGQASFFAAGRARDRRHIPTSVHLNSTRVLSGAANSWMGAALRRFGGLRWKATTRSSTSGGGQPHAGRFMRAVRAAGIRPRDCRGRPPVLPSRPSQQQTRVDRAPFRYSMRGRRTCHAPLHIRV